MLDKIMQDIKIKIEKAQAYFKSENIVRCNANGYDLKTGKYEVPDGFIKANSYLEAIRLLNQKTILELQQEGLFISDEEIEKIK